MTRRFLIFRSVLVALAIVAARGGLVSIAQVPAALTSADFSGLRFRNIGPAAMSGRFVDMDVVESNPYTMYVASATGGVFRTTDNGVTWTPVFEKEAVHSVGDIAIFQADPNVIWIGTGERANRQSVSWGDGVYKTTDGGRTWVNVGLRSSMHIGRIVTHPTNAQIVYVAAQGSVWGPGGDRGLYRTVDGGRTWTRTLFVDEDTGATDVAMDWNDPNVLYAATYQRRRSPFGFNGGGPGSALWKSTDAGATWKRLTGNGLPDGEYGRVGIAVYRKNPQVVYVSIEQGSRYNASTAYINRKGGLYRSNDGGATWRFISNWNPRPMYASQPTIDPQDDRRIYQLNSYSYSDNGGETFTSPRTTTHGDDRFVWVDPKDSRHVIKLDDGGIGISFDRGLKFLYVTSLPVSQFYHVAVDNAVPYNVYGGLQDNGCWRGPSASWSNGGILNQEWDRLCGGDGFYGVPDPSNPHTAYATSQFLGLVRTDTRTWQTQEIRPGDPTGAIADRRNWNTWGKSVPPQVLGNAMHPANWDAGLMLSPHDPATVYAGGQHLFRSRDRGVTWEDLGDMTTGVDRSTLPLMGRRPDENTLSIDDGVPYYPGIVSIAESPRRRGLLYVGTDDGRLRMSADDGRSWSDLQDRIPGLPKSSWFNAIEASRHADNTVYVAVDNHRSNDFANYLFKSTDGGRTFSSIAGDLPASRVVRVVREDRRNPNVLFVGTEFGLFYTWNGGTNWIELKNNLPTLAFNDLTIHPRDNDLVLGSHGRGVWILDKINALQELTPAVTSADAHLFSIAPAFEIRYVNLKPHAGDMIFRGENPANGAVIDFWVGRSETVSITVRDGSGRTVRSLPMSVGRAPVRGINRTVWNLREDDLPVRGGSGEDDDAPRRGNLTGPFVPPGVYTVRLEAAGKTLEQRVEVREDPRIDVTPAERRAWSEAQTQAVSLIRSFAPVNDRILASTGTGGESDDLKRQSRELMSRLGRLYGELARWVGAPTTDQLSELKFYGEMVQQLSAPGR